MLAWVVVVRWCCQQELLLTYVSKALLSFTKSIVVPTTYLRSAGLAQVQTNYAIDNCAR